MGFSSTYDPEKKVLLFKAKVTLPSGKEFVYPVAIGMVRDWVAVEIAVADLNEAPPDVKREKVLEGMLKANFLWPEVSYALNQSYLVSVAWSHKDVLSFENFKIEFDSALSGARDFPSIVQYASSFTKPPKQFSPIYQ
jgi:hypothetical protein